MKKIYICLWNISFILISNAMNDDAPGTIKKNKKVTFQQVIKVSASEAQEKIKEYEQEVKKHLKVARKTKDNYVRQERLNWAELCYCQIVSLYLIVFEKNPSDNSYVLLKASEYIHDTIPGIESIRKKYNITQNEQPKLIAVRHSFSKAENSFLKQKSKDSLPL